jgi:two-component system, OmpR family, sensor histidine kinase CiaH
MFKRAPWRLVAWNVAILFIILGSIELLLWFRFHEQIYSGADSELYQHRDAVISLLGRYNDVYVALTNAPDNYSYRTVIASTNGVDWTTDCPSITVPPCPLGSLAPTSEDAIQKVLVRGGQDIRTVSFHGNPYRVITFAAVVSDTPYVVQIGRIAIGEQESLDQLAVLLVIGAIIGVILTGAGSMFLANRALIPIRQAFSRQRQFTADASHELRTPLALIRANAEMLTLHGDRLASQDVELVNEIIHETDHLNRLVGDLLTLARADTEVVKIHTRPVDFRALVGEVHEDLQRIAESKGIESDLSLNGPVTVSGDEGRLRQLLLILLDNALKYTDPGGRVTITLGNSDRKARLTVADTGIGIPAADRPHIFERFYRVDRAREHESGGTGLGLSIAKWIVQAHNGEIKVESELGQGTAFHVDLPAS